MNQNTRKKNGFTMIELIAVIVILGILAAAAVPKFLDARKEAEEAVANGIVSAWQSACSMNVAQSILDGEAFKCPDGTLDNSAGAAKGDEIKGLTVDLGDNKFKIVATKSGKDKCMLMITGSRLDEAGVNGSFTIPAEVQGKETPAGE